MRSSIWGEIITRIPNNVVVPVLEQNNGWYEIYYDGQVGWIDSSYTTGLAESLGNTGNHHKRVNSNSFKTKAVNGNITVECNGLWINSKPFVNDGNLVIVPRGVKLHTTEESSNGWYKVTYKGVTGWIGGSPYSTFNAIAPKNHKSGVIGYITIQSPIGLYMNTTPTSYVSINCIGNGVTVPVIDQSNGWYEVNYKGQTGWVDGQYTSSVNSSSNIDNNQNDNFEILQINSPVGLHMRSSIWGNVLTTIPYDTTLRVINQSDGWYEVNYNGENGWIDGTFVNVI